MAVLTCASSFAESDLVVPILEPVTPLTDLLAQRIQRIADAGVSCSLVLNPSVGMFHGRDEWRILADFYVRNGLLAHHGVSILSNPTADHDAMSAWLEELRQSGINPALDIVHEKDLSVSLKGTTYRDVRWNVAEDRTVPNAFGLSLSGRPVIWSHDPFPGLPRNRDYEDRPEGIFSTRATTFRSAGYAGISDFLTIGSGFQPGGGPAYAVVIHLTYEKDNTIRIRHFCSNDNQTQDDPGGKFLEAVGKLAAFARQESLPSNPGLDALLELHRRQHFPGLGKVKEHSMVNHIMVTSAAVATA